MDIFEERGDDCAPPSLVKREVRGDESEARLSVTRGEGRGADPMSFVGEPAGLWGLAFSGLPVVGRSRARRVANVADHLITCS